MKSQTKEIQTGLTLEVQFVTFGLIDDDFCIGKSFTYCP